MEEQAIEHRIDPTAAVNAPSGQRLHLYQRVLISVVAAVGFVGLAAVYLASIGPNLGELISSLWVDRGHQDEVPPPVPVVDPLPPDALADIPLGFRKELLASSTLPPADFSRSFRQPIDQLCKYLDGLGFGKFTTMHNPVADGQWICSSDVLPVGDHATPSDVSSVFVWMRGNDRKEVDLLRLKVNLTDPATSNAAKSLALTVLGKLHASLGWDMPDALKAAIGDVRDANFSRYGVSYQITREWSSLPRLNVVIRVTDRSGIVPVDAVTAINADLLPRNRPTPRPMKLSKPPAMAATPNLEPQVKSESAPIENLMQ